MLRILLMLGLWVGGAIGVQASPQTVPVTPPAAVVNTTIGNASEADGNGTATTATTTVQSLAAARLAIEASNLTSPQKEQLIALLSPAPDPAVVRAQIDRLSQTDRSLLLNHYPESRGTLHTLLIVAAIAVALLVAGMIAWMHFLQKTLSTKATTLADLERLPLGVPPGSVRAVLALLVVATALLLFVLGGVGFDMPDSLIGIVGMVLGFYFGTRSGTADEVSDAYAEVARKAEELGEQKQQTDVAAAKAEEEKAAADRMRQDLDAERQLTQQLTEQAPIPPLEALLAQATRRVALGTTLVASARDSGLGGENAEYEAALSRLGALAEQARGAPPDGVTSEQRKAIADAIAALPDQPGNPASPIGRPFSAAAPLFAGVVVTGVADDRAKLALLLAVGAGLGSAAYLRWKARILWAPTAQLVDAATLTDQELEAVAELVPVLQDIPPGADRTALLRDAAAMDVVGPDALAAYGLQGATPLVDSLESLAVAVAHFRQELLARMARRDITADACNAVSRSLAAASSVFRLEAGRPTQQEVAALLDAGAAASATAAADDEEQEAEPAVANLHALVLLVDLARRDRLDLAALLAEMRDVE